MSLGNVFAKLIGRGRRQFGENVAFLFAAVIDRSSAARAYIVLRRRKRRRRREIAVGSARGAGGEFVRTAVTVRTVSAAVRRDIRKRRRYVLRNRNDAFGRFRDGGFATWRRGRGRSRRPSRISAVNGPGNERGVICNR